MCLHGLEIYLSWVYDFFFILPWFEIVLLDVDVWIAKLRLWWNLMQPSSKWYWIRSGCLCYINWYSPALIIFSLSSSAFRYCITMNRFWIFLLEIGRNCHNFRTKFMNRTWYRTINLSFDCIFWLFRFLCLFLMLNYFFLSNLGFQCSMRCWLYKKLRLMQVVVFRCQFHNCGCSITMFP